MRVSGVVALCHFCEQHGPRAVLCTQALSASLPMDTLTPPWEGPGSEDEHDHIQSDHSMDDDDRSCVGQRVCSINQSLLRSTVPLCAQCNRLMPHVWVAPVLCRCVVLHHMSLK